jgi:hypothetical protein
LPAASLAPLRAFLDRIFAALAETAREAERDRMAHAPHVEAAAPVVVSSLAEGSDRIVAAAGLAAGFALEAILPFGRAEYARDFATEASRREFDALLARASTVIELDAGAANRPHAYQAAGIAMLTNLNVLITIWNGEGAAGIGGTAEIVSRALAAGLIVVWVEPGKPDVLKLSRPAPDNVTAAEAAEHPQDCFAVADLAALARAVNALLARQRSIPGNLSKAPQA